MDKMQIISDIHGKYPPVACRIDKSDLNNILEKHIEENHCKIEERHHVFRQENFFFADPFPSMNDYIRSAIDKVAKEWTEKKDKWLVEELRVYGVKESEILDRVEIVPQYSENGENIYNVKIDGKYAFSFSEWIENNFDYRNPYTYEATFHIKMI